MSGLKNKLLGVLPELVRLWNWKNRSSRTIEILPDGKVLDINDWDEFTAGDGEEYRRTWTARRFVEKEYWRLRRIYFYNYLFWLKSDEPTRKLYFPELEGKGGQLS